MGVSANQIFLAKFKKQRGLEAVVLRQSDLDKHNTKQNLTKTEV
jgi:hypothetical protein